MFKGVIHLIFNSYTIYEVLCRIYHNTYGGAVFFLGEGEGRESPLLIAAPSFDSF